MLSKRRTYGTFTSDRNYLCNYDSLRHLCETHLHNTSAISPSFIQDATSVLLFAGMDQGGQRNMKITEFKRMNEENPLTVFQLGDSRKSAESSRVFFIPRKMEE